ncbi:MAG: hypothetical protein FWE90_13955 [Defluviitaleaceae bacterium]|nr:hypothetical protein [Defluviitaleaceae bacterium]
MAYPTMDTYAKRMTLIIGVTALAVIIGGVIYYRSIDALTFSLGTVTTACANLIKIFWLKRSVTVAAEMDPAYAPNYVRGHGMLRMLFTLAVLVGAGFLSQLDSLGFPFLFGAVFGLLTMPVAAYAMGFFVKKDYPQHNVEISHDNEGGDVNV